MEDVDKGRSTAAAAAWATEHKDLLSAGAFALAIVYAFGWSMESIAFLRLGMGNFAVPRETALCAGIFFFLGPGAVFAATVLGAPLSRSPTIPIAIAAGGFACHFVVRLFQVYPPFFFSRGYFSQCCLQFGIPAAFAILWPIMMAKKGDVLVQPTAQDKVGAGIVLVAASICYTGGMLDYLPPQMGGLQASKIHVVLKAPNYERDAYLLYSDDATILLAEPVTNPRYASVLADIAYMHRMTRVRWDRVVSITDYATQESSSAKSKSGADHDPQDHSGRHDLNFRDAK